MTIETWYIPALITVLVWALVILWPIDSQISYYDFGSPMEIFLRAMLALVVMLSAWLVWALLK